MSNLTTMLTCQKRIKFVNTVLGKFSFRSLSSSKALKMYKWQEEKEKYLSMPLDSKRQLYSSKEYSKLTDIPTWEEYAKKYSVDRKIPPKSDAEINSSLNSTLSKKISIWKGDITTLEVDAIVNAANKSLLGGGGVDGAIHRGAGRSLLEECKTLKGCETGGAKITGAYKLPAKYVIHTVGPQGEKPELLQQCYRNCLKIMSVNKLRSVAFPCISTGIYGYPNEAASHIAAYQVRKHLEDHNEDIDRVIFCIFLPQDQTIYEGILQSYFPLN